MTPWAPRAPSVSGLEFRGSGSLGRCESPERERVCVRERACVWERACERARERERESKREGGREIHLAVGVVETGVREELLPRSLK